jgi:predicted Zn finger-like uncharacterized protein
MYTFCPSCSTLFAIKAEHLLAANGNVRCGECGQVFRAFDCVYEELAAARAACADYRAPPSALRMNDQQAGHDGAVTDIDEDDGYGFDQDTASLIDTVYSGEWPERSNFWRDAAYGAGVVTLLLLFGLQWLYFHRAELAADNHWRPGLERLCSLLHCHLPLQVDLSRIELINRDVRKHPQVADALLINATLVNHAAFTQPYPILALTFLNTSGTPVAARRFKPAEYLGDHADIKAGMPPDTPVQVVLEIEDPGEDAVSFQFDFL